MIPSIGSSVLHHPYCLAGESEYLVICQILKIIHKKNMQNIFGVNNMGESSLMLQNMHQKLDFTSPNMSWRGIRVNSSYAWTYMLHFNQQRSIIRNKLKCINKLKGKKNKNFQFLSKKMKPVNWVKKQEQLKLIIAKIGQIYYFQELVLVLERKTKDKNHVHSKTN